MSENVSEPAGDRQDPAEQYRTDKAVETEDQPSAEDRQPVVERVTETREEVVERSEPDADANSS